MPNQVFDAVDDRRQVQRADHADHHPKQAAPYRIRAINHYYTRIARLAVFCAKDVRIALQYRRFLSSSSLCCHHHASDG